jgi:LmbE family N-acetylglucosaminyl deacetylase
MIHRRAASSVLALLLLVAPAGAQLLPIPQDTGSSGLALALRRLASTARILYVTAHPDDEPNEALVRLSRSLGHRTALLTLTRGEGGQNEIGDELFERLGVLRSEELLAVHRYDGAEQYFARAYEFGFSYSLDETLQRWGHDETLGDVVRVVRSFRPDVILTLPLQGTSHQHHVAAAQLAKEAFRAAADPARYPEQLARGLRPWQARKIYQGGVGGPASQPLAPSPAVTLETGIYDPILGLTANEIGSLARAFHRTQGTSQLKAAAGPAPLSYWLVDSEPPVAGKEADLLDGIDPSFSGLSRFAAAEESRASFLAGDLGALRAQVDAAEAAFDPRAPEKTLPALASGLDLLRRLRTRLQKSAVSEAARSEILARLAAKERDFREAIALGQGLGLEVTSEDGDVVPGQSFTVTATAYNQGAVSVRVDDVALSVPEGWKAKRLSGEPRTLEPRQSLQARFSVRVGDRARFSQPYWRRSGSLDRYEIDAPGAETLPFAPPDVVGTLQFTTSGVVSSLERPAVWRYEGRWVGGEKQKTVSVVPPLSITATPAIVVMPLATPKVQRDVRVAVTNQAPAGAEVVVRLEAPVGFAVEPREAPVRLRYEREEISLKFTVTAPPGLKEGDAEIRAVARSGETEWREGFDVIAYDHVQERHYFHPALTRVKAVEVRTATGVSVGYVAGAGDDVAGAIWQLGVPVTLISENGLATGDLAKYTTIVTGIRAYRARPDLRTYHQRLMRYVEEGGNLVVQFNRAEFNQTGPLGGLEGSATPGKSDSPFAPYPAAVTTERITDEAAEVKLLLPDHPVFAFPNRISPRDFEGWVSERGSSFLEARDKRYSDLVAMSDPFPLNPGEKKGALVEARVGKGTWTYVGLSLHRQLQAGVTGAYRLLANLVSRPRGR